MGRFTTAAKVGFFAAVMVVAGLLIWRFVNKTAGSRGGYTVYVLLDDATGIAKYSQVKIAGIPVGNIDDVRLEGARARIDIKMRPEVALFDDAAVSKQSASLLGEYFLGLAPGTAGKRQLEDGDQIKNVIAAASTDDILKDVGDIAKKVKIVADALATTVGSEEGKGNVKDTLKNLADVTDQLNKTVRENRASIRSILTNVDGITSRGAPEVEGILKDIRTVTTEVRKLTAVSNGDGKADPGEIRQIISKLNQATTTLERSLDNVETVSGRLARGEGTLGRLSKDEKLINEIEGITEDVGNFVGGINRLQTIVGLRTDYQFLSGTVKSYVELRLQPREDKYYSIEIVNDPKGYTRYEQVDVDSTNPNDPGHYREIRTVTTNAFRFSLQFAQRFGPVTGRFGIKESTGGVGLDLALFDDRFELRQDLFGFGEVIRPRWRIGLGYEFITRLWLMGGVDDVLTPERRDYFVGMSLMFNDEDLKSILPFAPGP